LSHLINIYRNKKTYSYQPLTNPDISNSIDLDQDSCCFGKQDPISAYPSELNQTSNVENPIDNLASYYFPEIKLEHEYDPEPQLDNSISLPDPILTEVFLSDFRPFLESVLDPVPIHREIESPIFYDQQIKLDQFYTLDVPLTNWQVFLSKKLNLDKNVTLILKFVIQFKFLNQY